MTYSPFYFSRFEFWLTKICLISLLSISSLGSTSHAAFNGFQVEPHGIPLDEILSGGPPRDGIPTLMNPQFLPANKVEFLSSEDRVLGIQGVHQIKAYPIGTLNWHEIVNDTLDGTPIVITNCALCGTGIGFLRKVGNDIISFVVSGLLYQMMCSCMITNPRVSGHKLR